MSEMKILEFLQLVRKRTPVILGVKSLNVLDLVCMGFIWGKTKDESDNSLNILGEFHNWIFDKFGYEKTNIHSSSAVILDLCGDNQAEAFEKFYLLLDEFLLVTDQVPLYWEIGATIPSFKDYEREKPRKIK